jgi:flagellar basal body-associated protein FliL
MVLFFALVALIVAGTAYWVFVFDDTSSYEQMEIKAKNGEGQTFTGIGRIRIFTSDPQPGIVILFVSFIYYPDDKGFSEELVLKIKDFRDIVQRYVGSLTIAELQEQEEENIKSELLGRFNAVLLLGQIETLFFSDFIIVG